MQLLFFAISVSITKNAKWGGGGVDGGVWVGGG